MSVKSALNIDDLRTLAKKRLPLMVFDYIDGGADDELTLGESVRRFSDYQLVWDALVDVANIDLRTTVMGCESTLPFVISPTAATRLFNPRHGERGVARAAHEAGMIYSASTLGAVRLEELADIHTGPKWFQVYVWRDNAIVEAVLKRARAAGFRALVLTVDAPVGGNRERDPRNGFTIPPQVNLKTATQALARPQYLWDLMTTETIGIANFPNTGSTASVADFIDQQFDRTVGWDYVSWLKDVWQGPIAVKGISHVSDAEKAIAAGADCVWISNHGGRQLETSRPTIDILPEIKAAVGDRCEIILDGGLRRGTDIIKALALGADAVAIGRAYLFGVAAGGEAGVKRTIEILRTELERDLALMGCPNVSNLSPRFVHRPQGS